MKPYTVGGNPLDEQQMAAATDDAPSELVVAGAGTGKTTTLIGRLKHLRELGTDPKGILVISLTNASVDDLRRKIRTELPEYIPEVMTIHALGNRILRKRPMVGAHRTELIGSIIADMTSDERLARAVMIQVDSMRKSGFGDIAYNGSVIRNRGLRIFSDCLFECGIRSEYTPPLYSGPEPNPACLTAEDGRGHRLKLYSDDEIVGSAAKKPAVAKEFMESRGFILNRMSTRELSFAVLNAWRNRIPESIGAFISRCKSTGTTIGDLRKANVGNSPETQYPVEERLRLIDRVWDSYTMVCDERNLADYDDMVVQSSHAVRSGISLAFSFTDVLIDEYQDASPMLVDLVRSLRERMGFRLFCVGDDWQSIYGFTGGDVWQMIDFGDIWSGWGRTSEHRIEKTYRSPQQIVDIASKFVQKNPKQLRKEIKGRYSPGIPPVHLVPTSSDRDIQRMIANRLENLDPNESVFVIGRTRADIYALGNGSGQFEFQLTGQESGSVDVVFRRRDDEAGDWCDDRTIRFLTAHSSKGLEADNVFVIADREKGGFPSQTTDDISELFPSNDEGIEFAEERRVFYVAMTRARKRLFLVNLMDEGFAMSSDSPFMKEIISDNGPIFVKSTVFCSECYGPMRIINVKGRRFYGCCDYPNCRSTKPFYGL